MITYRETDPVSGRWTGNNGGSDLSAFQIDQNFWTLESAVTALQSTSALTVGIDFISQDSTTKAFYFHMTDHSIQGPFVAPVTAFNFLGDWNPFTVLNVNDVFSENGAIYLVIYPHTSAATFSAGANDGAGHNFYAEMLALPGSSLPTGGATGMMLSKSSGADFAVTWNYAIPTGGTAAQYLVKVNSTNFNTAWATLSVSMESLSDFSLISPLSIGQGVQWNGTAWQNTNLSVNFNQITDIVLTSPHSVGDVLTWNGSHWQNEPSSGGGVSNLFDLADVSVNENSFINGYALVWNNADGFWEAVKPYFRNPTVTTLGASGAVNLDPSPGNVFRIFPTANVTINATSTAPGAEISIIIQSSGTSSFNVTFGSNFKSQGVLATGTVDGKNYVVKFIGDNGAYGFLEASRTAAM